MRMTRGILFLWGWLAFSVATLAGPVPFFRNFTPAEYGAMSQNWSLAQDGRGYVYVGNNSCLLRYNGRSWDRFYPFGDNKEAIIRSLYADPDSGRIYIGSFREFGYLEYDAYGGLVYTSLYGRLASPPPDSEEIWYITRLGECIYFIYFTSCYIYDTRSGILHREVAPTSYFYEADGDLILSSSSGSARRYRAGSFDHEPEPLPAFPKRMVKLFPGEGRTKLAVSATDGLFQMEGSSVRRIDGLKGGWDVANRAIQCADSSIVVGFLSGGVYAFAPTGEILWHIDTEAGLGDNTVLALMEDRSGHIWCALDKGVAVIFKGGDQWLSLSDYHLGKISVSLLDGDHLFVGSNQGLSYFQMDRSSLSLRKLAGFFPNSPLWSLAREDGQVFIGENGGAYLFHDGRMRHLSTAPGGTAPRLLTLQDGSEVLIQGSFTNLYVYRRAGGEWQYSHSVSGLMAPVRHIEVDYLGNIWLECMYEGLKRIRLAEDGRSVSVEEGYFGGGIRVCKMGGRVLFHNPEGFWFYDDQTDAMAPFAPLNQLQLGDCRRVIPAGKERWWLVRRDDAVLIRFRDDRAEKLDRLGFGELNVSLTELFESIIPVSDSRFLFGVENGFLVHDLPRPAQQEAQLRFSSISTFDGQGSRPVPLDVPALVLPHNASFTLSLAALDVKYQQADVRYQLEDFDYDAQVLGPGMTATYTRMPAGSYTFSAWLADAPGQRLTLPVVVKPSFFASTPAILLYFLVAAVLVAGVYWRLRRAFRRQRARLEAEKEKELLTLRNEQLEASVLLKSKELATYSLLEASRNHVLQKIKEELSRIHYGKPGSLAKKDYDALSAIIRDGEFSESSWEHFYTQFDLIHKSFFRTLRERHPELSTNDLRICAYLRLNMSTKELAGIMGVTPKGAEAAKYRLRKKLGLSSNVSISDYLSLINGGEMVADNQ